MSLQANKSGLKSCHSYKVSQLQTGVVYFKICGVDFGYYCHLRSDFSVKFAHFTDVLHLKSLWQIHNENHKSLTQFFGWYCESPQV